MTQVTEYPFRLDNAFFISLQLGRLPKMPDQLTLEFAIDVRVQDHEFPSNLQVDVKLRTVGEQPLTMNVELVGLFCLVDGAPEPEPDIITDFVNKRALHMLWPYMVQMVKQVTAQMGINPVNIATPYSFRIDSAQKGVEPSETEEGEEIEA